jgi:hypothetical protein
MASDSCPIKQVRSAAGHPAWWCDAHGATATTGAGERLDVCGGVAAVAAEDPSRPTLTLGLGDYPAGFEARSLIPPAYDTTASNHAVLWGIHVHGRNQPAETLDLHAMFGALRMEMGDGEARRFVRIDHRAGEHYVVSTSFGLPPKYLECPTCLTPFVDEGVLAVTPRSERVCGACHTIFGDSELAIANPFRLARRTRMGEAPHGVVDPPKALDIHQADYGNGVQLWGPEEALVYTAPTSEIETGGMHTHLYAETFDEANPAVEDNFVAATLDGVALDPRMMRLMMSQRLVPELRLAVRAFDCPACGEAHFDDGRDGCTPHLEHECHRCGHRFPAPGADGPTIGNPILAALDRAARTAPRPMQGRFWAETTKG